MQRRALMFSLAAVCISAPLSVRAEAGSGQKLARAARSQIGVTLGYDPRYTHLHYPGGDVDRSTGVCADVVIRAARDAFGIDMQQLVHDDMVREFDAYPARRTWGSKTPDANIDHRRVLNLETYWQRAGCQLWHAKGSVPGDGFPAPLAVGDIVTWRLDARLPHVGIVAQYTPQRATVIHNIGNGAEETPLQAFQGHRATGLYRWPKTA